MPTDPQELATAMERLADALEARPDSPFSEEDITHLRDLIALAKRLAVLGWAGKWLLWFLAATAGVISQWERINVLLRGGG